MQKNYLARSGLAVLALTPPGVYADNALVQKQLLKQYSQVYSLWSRQDATKLRSWFDANSTPNFSAVDSGGKLHPRQEMIAEIMAVSQRPDIQDGHFHYTIDKVNVSGQTAVVNLTEVRTFQDDEGTKQNHLITSRVKSRDTWVKVSGSWKWQQRQSAPKRRIFVDGKPETD